MAGHTIPVITVIALACSGALGGVITSSGGPAAAVDAPPNPAAAAPRQTFTTKGWRWPLAAPHRISRGFRVGPEPWSSGHRGTDLLGSPGCTVRAAHAGTVSYVGTIAGRGVIVIAHEDWRESYEPVDAIVALGTYLEAEAPIGALQSEGSHCLEQTCLHWGVRRSGGYRNPLTLIGQWPVLLPPVANSS